VIAEPPAFALRLAAAPRQVVIELNTSADDYQVVEGALSTGHQGIEAVLATLVPAQPPGFSARDFQNYWPSQPPRKVKKINEALKEMWEAASGPAVRQSTQRAMDQSTCTSTGTFAPSPCCLRLR
jgi:hypothetical protein